MPVFEFLATLVRILYERIQSDVEMPFASIGGEGSNVLEVRLEEGDAEDDTFTRDMLWERWKAFAMEKPRRYYTIARGRAPGIYMSWAEIEPLVSW